MWTCPYCKEEVEDHFEVCWQCERERWAAEEYGKQNAAFWEQHKAAEASLEKTEALHAHWEANEERASKILDRWESVLSKIESIVDTLADKNRLP